MTAPADLIPGRFYWVLLVADPEGESWENQPMPARYQGMGENGKPQFLTVGCEDDTWPVLWIGQEIVMVEGGS